MRGLVLLRLYAKRLHYRFATWRMLRACEKVDVAKCLWRFGELNKLARLLHCSPADVPDEAERLMRRLDSLRAQCAALGEGSK
jgi:hypothetical protein